MENELTLCPECGDKQTTCRECGHVTMLALTVAGPEGTRFCCTACAESYTRDMLAYTQREAEAARLRFLTLSIDRRRSITAWNAYAARMTAQ